MSRAHRKHDVTFSWLADMKIAAVYFLFKNMNVLATLVINVIYVIYIKSLCSQFHLVMIFS